MQWGKDMERQARNSSIELLRIVTIILIIFHHFNIHGIWAMEESHSLLSSWQMFVSCMTGWGGNVGNEIFMIITGYFMITGKVHWKKLYFCVQLCFCIPGVSPHFLGG